ncbi:hypothetical protein NPN14_24365, partial [Vibrio parahaemolyticus]|uniref:hypothetical protein n=1 Tax=Vibrio parahaemolyticus TaxID=670 RepID=UPI002110EEB7
WMAWVVALCAVNKVHQNFLKDISYYKLQLFLKHPSLPEELEPVISAIRELCRSDRPVANLLDEAVRKERQSLQQTIVQSILGRVHVRS